MTAPYSNTTILRELARHGVRHLRSVEDGGKTSPLDPEALISELAQHAEPRFRESLVPLFLQHPEYADLVPRLADTLPPPSVQVLHHMYTAAVYLQRFWRGALSLYQSETAMMPDHFGRSLFHLPGPDDHFGELGLRLLARTFQEKTGDEWYAAYQSLMRLLLEQLRLESHGRQTQ